MKLNLSVGLFKRLTDVNLIFAFSLAGVIILGAFFRFYKIEKCCLSGDEVLTVGIISVSNLKEVWNDVAQGFHGDLPVYYCFLYLWSRISDSVLWLKSFSAICGTLLIWVSYKLAKLLFNRRIALLSAFLVSTSPLLIFYSRVLRYYSFVSLLHLISLYFFIRLIRKNNLFLAMLYVLSTVLGLYVNYSTFLFVFAQAVFILFYRNKYPLGFKLWLKCLISVLILWFPLSGYSMRDFGLLIDGEGFSRTPLNSGVLGLILSFFFSFSLGETVSPFNYSIAAGAFAVHGVIWTKFIQVYLFSRQQEKRREEKRREEKRRENVVFIILSLFIVSLLCALSEYNAARYIKAASVLYVIIASAGMLSFSKRPAVILFILAVLFQIYSLGNLYAKKEYHRKEFADSWDKIAEFVEANSGNKDVIVFNSIAFEYYMEKINSLKSIHNIPESRESTRQFIKENIELPGVKRIILVDSPLSGLRMKDFEDEIALLKDYLIGHNYRLVSQECFDPDNEAFLRRKFVDRPFPECRTTVYVYMSHN